MPLSYNLVTPPTVEPVSVQQAKQQCRVDFMDEDALFAIYIKAARQLVEKILGRAIFSQTWQRTLDHFPLWWSTEGTVNPNYRNDWPYYSDFWNRITIDLPMPKTVSVSSITYVDMNGDQQTLDPDSYVVDVTSIPARIVPAQGTYWPSQMTYIPGSVVITYIAGSYGDGVTVNNCPENIVLAILLLVEHWYTNRGASGAEMKAIPFGVDALLDPEKILCMNYRPT